MVPIGPILEDIKAKIGTNDVRLPRVGETISRFTGGTDVGSLVDSASYTTPVATVPQSYHLVSPLNLDGPVLSSKDQLIQYLRSNRYNTIIDLRRVERILAQSDDAAISETMSSAWRSYVDSHSLLSELRGLTRNYPFSSECLDEAKILVLEDPKSVRSWNYCWMILVKIQSERLIQKHASAMATKPEMWGNQTPTPQHVELLYQRLVAEWTRAVLQMLKLWDQPPSMTDH